MAKASQASYLQGRGWAVKVSNKKSDIVILVKNLAGTGTAWHTPRQLFTPTSAS